MDEHIKHIKMSFYSRMWSLRNLKRSGFDVPDLIDFYCSLLRPVVEFCAAVYGSFLSKQQSSDLERLQKHALNVIVGRYGSYTEACEKYGIEKLSDRRANIIEKFALKATQSDRFGNRWFPLKSRHGYEARCEREFFQNKPRTERMQKGPLYSMTDILNDLAS